MHEDFSREGKVEASSDRAFGLVMAAFFVVVALAPLLHSPREPRWWALVVAAVFAVLAVSWTAPLGPLNRLWVKLGLALSRIVTPIVLGLVFYVTIAPIGFLLRAVRKDLLRLRPDPDARSYWIERQPSGRPSQSMKQQF
jgi:saxitoxin biosynthesis operon SxtJ-like protein